MWNFVLSSTLMRNNYKHKGIWFEFYFARYISPFSNLQDYTLRPCEDTKSSGENQKELFWRIKKICQLFDFTCENGNGKKKGRKHLISNLPKYKFLLPQNIMSMFVVPFSYTFDVFNCFTYFPLLHPPRDEKTRIRAKHNFSDSSDFFPSFRFYFVSTPFTYVIEILIYSKFPSYFRSFFPPCVFFCLRSPAADNKNEKHWQRHWHLFTQRLLEASHTYDLKQKSSSRRNKKIRKAGESQIQNKSHFNINLRSHEHHNHCRCCWFCRRKIGK